VIKHSGVVNKKLTVITKVMTAPTLPRKDAFGEIGLNAIRSATEISTTPMTPEAARELRNEYIQDMSGLCKMRGLMPSASATVNF